MERHVGEVSWSRGTAPFTDRRYSRAHEWRFDGGAVVPASASPHHVPLPYADPRGVDPEEALVAAVASRHRLSFLRRPSAEEVAALHHEAHGIGFIANSVTAEVVVEVPGAGGRAAAVGPDPVEREAG